MDLLGIVRRDNFLTLKTTVLHRPKGTWHQTEVDRIVNGLMTEASQHPRHPEYVILFGHYTKEKVLKAMLGGVAFTATEFIGIQNAQLPFRPGFA